MKVGREAHALYALKMHLELYPSVPNSRAAQKIVTDLRAKGVKTPTPTQRGLARLYSDAQMVFCENEPGKELYIVKSGKVEILKITPPEEMLLSILGKATSSASFPSSPASRETPPPWQSVRRRCSPWPANPFLPCSKNPRSTIARILTAISQRLWFTFIRLQSSFYTNPMTRSYVLLENKLLEERISLSSTKPVTLPLGIGEILGMARVPADQQQKLAELLTDDANLSFQFRQVTIENPSQLESRARYFRTRDHLGSQELKENAAGRRKAPAPEPASAQEKPDRARFSRAASAVRHDSRKVSE